MANLSDLLNPFPTEGSDTLGQRDSLASAQIPANPYAAAAASDAKESGVSGDIPFDQSAQPITASTSDPQPSPTGWHSSTGSMVTLQGIVEQAQISHHPSLHAESSFGGVTSMDDYQRKSSGASIDRYQQPPHSPEQLMRKMSSSSSLEQYHMATRSPEQQRRASLVGHPDPDFKLPPLQQLAHSRSQQQQPHPIPRHEANPPSPPASAPSRTQTFAERIPPLTFPTAAPLPPPTALAESPTVPVTEAGSPPPIKTEAGTTLPDPIPAFIPVAQVKREQTTPSAPGPTGATPIPTTEEMPPSEVRGTKRAAPKAVAKKGTAKKSGPPAKKQKTSTTADAKAKSRTKVTAKKPSSASATPLGASPAPRSARDASSPLVKDESGDEDQFDDEDEGTPDPDADLYCICRKPDTGTFMIGCDGQCDDWFHGKCVGIQERDKNLIDRYICPKCEDNGVGVTTWKRMCRRPGCRMPARLVKDQEPSKYCSDKCGVDFFRDQLGRTRGVAETLSSSRRKSHHQPSASDDAGPKGGMVNKAELKALVTAVSTVDDFKRLGDGVLSSSDTPVSTEMAVDPKVEAQLSQDEVKRLAEIEQLKSELRDRHTTLKDQSKLIGMIKNNKPKDSCGYDDRIRMDEVAFAAWRESVEGQQALNSGNLSKVKKEVDGDVSMDGGEGAQAVGPCSRKKCQKHYEWAKLAGETNRNEISMNSSRMREVEEEEAEIKRRAEIKARQALAGDFGGTVEVHRPEETSTVKATVPEDRPQLSPDSVPDPPSAPATAVRNAEGNEMPPPASGAVDTNMDEAMPVLGSSADWQEAAATATAA